MDTNFQLTFDEYDEMLKRFEKVNSPTLWPCVDAIDIMEKEPQKWIIFAIYILEKNNPPKNNKEKYSQKNLKTFVNKHLELVDTEEEISHRPDFVNLL